MVNVTNRANVTVRFRTLKLFLGHFHFPTSRLDGTLLFAISDTGCGGVNETLTRDLVVLAGAGAGEKSNPRRQLGRLSALPLSYTRTVRLSEFGAGEGNRTLSSAWKAVALPLSYTRFWLPLK